MGVIQLKNILILEVKYLVRFEREAMEVDIKKTNEGFEVDGITFATIDAAERYIQSNEADDVHVDDHKILFSTYGLLTRYKACEVDVRWSTFKPLRTLLDCNVSYRTKTDHAGLSIFIIILRLKLEFNIYDTRHWNNQKECWE